ncbi:transposase [Reticulibacter mediterranei]|nr:transposase [Reticulibacter mediterranei]
MHSPAASGKSGSTGLRWIVMAVVVTPAWSKQPWSLPFLVVLSTAPAFSVLKGKRHKTIAMWASQMISLMHRWLPDRDIVVLGDGAYNCLALGLQATKRSVTLITPGQLDHAFHDPLLPAEHRPKGGKPRIVGKRQPNLDQVLVDPSTQWQENEVQWYGQGIRVIQWCSGTAWWHRAKLPPLPIRWVLVRDPSGKYEPNVLVCSNPNWQALLIIATYMKRWSLEGTFEEARAHLGIQTQRQWSDLAIERTTPLRLVYLQFGDVDGNPSGCSRADRRRAGRLVSQICCHLS